MKPNSHECAYFGRKLSNTICDIQTTADEICIGSDQDDEIYFYEGYEGEVLKERVKIYIESHENYNEIDLEDVIRFAVQNCLGIVQRVMEEEK